MRKSVCVAAVAGLVSGVLLAGPAHGAVPADPARVSGGPVLTVDVKAGRHSISPDIYGVNFADEAFATSVGLPVDRWGGDATETYNWKVRGANQGANWYFENFPDCWTVDFGYCETGRDYSAFDDLVETDARTGATTLATLPAAGWVAKSVAYDQDQLCSYPAAVFDPQDDHDPYHPVCGNGERNGHWITSPAVDPTRAGTPAGAAWDGDWVADLVSRYGSAAAGGVGLYEIGNEPGLWNSTHRDFHPDPVDYDELWSTSRAIASAVKAADPTAGVLGPSEWGWPNYFCSAADLAAGGCSPSSPDRAAHGGTDISSWYLQQFARREQQTGVRLLDYFDLHYYPQGGYSPTTDVTRSLWDPTYRDPSWIGERIRLLPRMQAWVDGSYPGTKTSLTEYNMSLGVTDDVRLQNVIQADTLGIFGREGLDLATFWPEERSGIPEAAFGIFRNYDGLHHGFGNRGVRATSADAGRVSVFAARRGGAGPLTVVVVNKSTTALTSRLSLEHFPHARAAQAYQYAGAGIVALGKVAVGRSGFTGTYPGQSVTLVEIRPR
ncbi:glycoside hydrolase family 44 protein [Nocardioides sp.]|uniref:glycoside hydrolase family 44 protein n=1 Tax=Nocardioides sp. TaxID=35761 RepID=UPI0037834C6A